VARGGGGKGLSGGDRLVCNTEVMKGQDVGGLEDEKTKNNKKKMSK
jgi:hypothetical protein